MQQKNYLTLSGYNRLKKELTDLVTRERPELVQTINWAASNGDRSENGDYIYGKRKLREVDKRIHYLTKKLEMATVIDPSIHKDSEQVFFGAEVTIIKSEGEEQTITIVGQDEIDPKRNHVSWNSPLARNLLRKYVGDSFTFKSPSGSYEVEIIAVNYSKQYT